MPLAIIRDITKFGAGFLSSALDVIFEENVYTCGRPDTARPVPCETSWGLVGVPELFIGDFQFYRVIFAQNGAYFDCYDRALHGGYFILSIDNGKEFVHQLCILVVFTAQESEGPNLELVCTRSYFIVEGAQIFLLLLEHFGRGDQYQWRTLPVIMRGHYVIWHV